MNKVANSVIMKFILTGMLIAVSVTGAFAQARYNPAALSEPPAVQGTGNGFPVVHAIDVTWPKYGAKCDDTTDDTAAIASALADGAANNLPVLGGYGTCKVTHTVTVDVGHTSLSDITLDGGSFSNSTILSVTTSLTDPNTMAAAHSAHPLNNVRIIGPGYVGGVTTICITLTPTTIAGTPWIPSVVFRGGGTKGCQVGVYTSGGAFAEDFDNFQILASQSGVYLDAGANAGERPTFRNMFINNLAAGGCGVFVNLVADVQFENGSIDADGCLLQSNVGGATIFARGSHFEDLSTDTDVMFKAGAVDSKVSIVNSNIAIDVSRANYVGFTAVSGSTPNLGGIFFKNDWIGFGTNAYNFDYLLNGLGPCIASGNMWNTTGSKSVACAASSALQDPDFAVGTADWTSATGFARVTGGGGPNGSSTYATLTNSSGQVSVSTGAIACRPGQQTAFTLWIKTTGLVSSSSSFNYNVSFVNAQGATITQVNTPFTTDVANWTLSKLAGSAPIPAGTVSCKLNLFLSGAVSGSATVSVGNINFESQ